MGKRSESFTGSKEVSVAEEAVDNVDVDVDVCCIMDFRESETIVHSRRRGCERNLMGKRSESFTGSKEVAVNVVGIFER